MNSCYKMILKLIDKNGMLSNTQGLQVGYYLRGRYSLANKKGVG